MTNSASVPSRGGGWEREKREREYRKKLAIQVFTICKREATRLLCISRAHHIRATA